LNAADPASNAMIGYPQPSTLNPLNSKPSTLNPLNSKPLSRTLTPHRRSKHEAPARIWAGFKGTANPDGTGAPERPVVWLPGGRQNERNGAVGGGGSVTARERGTHGGRGRSRGGRSEAEEAVETAGIGVGNPLLVDQNVRITYPDMNFKKHTWNGEHVNYDPKGRPPIESAAIVAASHPTAFRV
jgi:hypothetical protein